VQSILKEFFPFWREFSENDRFKNEGFEGYLFPVGWNFQKMKGLKTRDLKDFCPLLEGIFLKVNPFK
jgi:hypothetical protein